MTRRSLWAAGIFVVVLGVYIASPIRQEGDSFRVNAVAQHIVEHGTIGLSGTDLRDRHWLEMVDGKPYSMYPPGEAFLAVPFVAGADLAGFRPDTVGRDSELQVIEASVLVAGTAALVFLIVELGVGALGPRRRRLWAVGTALVFALGTSAWSVASRAMWQHGPVMVCLALACYLALRSKDEPRLAAYMGLPLGAAYFMRPTASIPIVALSAWVLVCRRRQLLGYLAGLGAVLAAFVFVAANSYHSLLPYYYAQGSLWHFQLDPTGIAGQIVSPSRGLLVFSPVAALAVVGVVVARRRHSLDGLSVALAAAVVGHWLTVGSSSVWWGGLSYGPRYMGDVLPLLIVLALPALAWLAQAKRGPLWAVAASGTAVAVVSSVAFNVGGAWSTRAMAWSGDLWSWNDPQFLRGLPFTGYAQVFAVLAFVGVTTAMAVSLRQPAVRPSGVPLAP